MLRHSLKTIFLFALTIGTLQSAYAAAPCRQVECDAQCREDYRKNSIENYRTYIRYYGRNFIQQCNPIPDPEERDKCYEKNIAYEQGYPMSDTDAKLSDFWKYSPSNPAYKACIEEYNANKTMNERARIEKNRQKVREETDRESTRREAEDIKRQAEKDALQERLQQEHAAQYEAEKQQRSIQAAVQAQTTDMLNQHAESQFRLQGMSNGAVQQGLMNVLQGVLNK